MLLALFLLMSANPVKAAEEIGGRAFYDLGVFAFEDGDYTGAEENFTTALNYEPDNPVYWHYLGKVFFKTDRYQEAEDAFKKTIALDPKLPGLQYDLAYLYFKKADYTKAADLFSAIVSDDPGNVLANYYAGISLHKLRRYSAAVNYFTAAADKSPTIKASGYYYAGTCYNKMGRTDSALEKFQYVRDHGDSESLRQNAIKYIKSIESRQKAMKPYGLYAKIGYMYDGNVMLDPINEDLFTGKEDGAIVGYFSGTYDFIRREAYKIGAGYSHYQSYYFDLSEYNLIGSTINVYAKYNLFPLILGFSILPSHYWLDGDDYLERYQFRPEIKYNVNQNLTAKASYSYHIVNHIQNNDKDGHNNEGFFGFDYRMPKDIGFFYGGIGLERFSATSSDEDFSRLKASVGISLKDSSSGVYVNLLGEYNDRQYNNIDSFYLKKRADDKYYVSISLSRKILYDWLSISVEYNYTKNISNISDFEYKKNAGNLSLTANL